MPGEVVALVGDNGAGKSTLVKVIAGVYTPDTGKITFDGREVAPRGPSQAQALGIATVFQDLALCDNLHVVANLFLGQEHKLGPIIDEVSMEKEAWRLLKSLSAKIPSVRIPIAALSGGQRQTVAIARSLVGEPEDRDARRADRRAGRGPDGRGAQPDRASPRQRARRHPGQPQHGRRPGGRRPHRRPSAWPQRRRVQRHRDEHRREIVAAITGASDNVVTERAERQRFSERGQCRDG